jgi:hypothetical protein
MKFKLVICVLIVAVFTAIGCKKSKQNKLTGSWDLLPQSSTQQDDSVVYEFDSENLVYMSANGTAIDTADYNLRSDFTKYYLDITGARHGGVDGKYLIEKLDKKVLVLQCESPYMRKEFTKHDE